MKKIGILGGLAWPATVEYYQAICRFSQDYHSKLGLVGPSPMPEMCIESVNINYSFNHRGNVDDDASWQEYDAYFNSALKRLENNGVDFIIITANTLHTRLKTITDGITVPVLSIYDAIANECKEHQINDFLFLGTEPTMKSKAFPDFMRLMDINAFAPSKETMQSKVTSLISTLFKGEIESSREVLNNVINEEYAQRDSTRQTVCLACTELPLAFRGNEHLPVFEENGVTYLNTTIIHAKAAFDYAVH